MKWRQFNYIALSGLVLLSVILKGCHKQDPDYISSTDYDPRIRINATTISSNSAVLEGGVQSKDYYTIIECGFSWGKSHNITGSNIIDNITPSNFAENIVFRDTLTGLIPKTTYYFRAFTKYTHPGSSILRQVGSAIDSFAIQP
jgi:hypothetical protein